MKYTSKYRKYYLARTANNIRIRGDLYCYPLKYIKDRLLILYNPTDIPILTTTPYMAGRLNKRLRIAQIGYKQAIYIENRPRHISKHKYIFRRPYTNKTN